MSGPTILVNPHLAPPISLLGLVNRLWLNRQLIIQMTKREVIGRYQGSAMGLAWSFLNPIFMLVVYTFVFSEIFKSRWGGVGGDDSKTQFAVVLFEEVIA
jgi:lipopolysaccharide transport system permease protein